jgi:hypothetical protein
MSPEEHLADFESRLAHDGFLVQRSGSNPVVFRLVRAGQNAGQVKVWPPLKAKFNEIRDQWRDAVRKSWEADATAVQSDPRHWLELDRLLALFSPYRDDYFDFEDLARALNTALRESGATVTDVSSLRYDYDAIERAVRSSRESI